MICGGGFGLGVLEWDGGGVMISPGSFGFSWIFGRRDVRGFLVCHCGMPDWDQSVWEKRGRKKEGNEE